MTARSSLDVFSSVTGLVFVGQMVCSESIKCWTRASRRVSSLAMFEVEVGLSCARKRRIALRSTASQFGRTPDLVRSSSTNRLRKIWVLMRCVRAAKRLGKEGVKQAEDQDQLKCQGKMRWRAKLKLDEEWDAGDDKDRRWG